MVLEYNKFIENDDIIIEIINGQYWDFILNEEYNDFKKYHTKYKSINLTTDQTLHLKNIENIVNLRLKSINPFFGNFSNDKLNKVKGVEFEIKPLEHWYEKFLRSYIEGDEYINPDPLEGIDIIYNNKDYFARLIENRPGIQPQILNGYRVMIRCKKTFYTEICFFKKNKSKQFQDISLWEIELQSSMKGKKYLDDNINRFVNACP